MSQRSEQREHRRGLGRGLGSLIPTAPTQPSPFSRRSPGHQDDSEQSPASPHAAADPAADGPGEPATDGFGGVGDLAGSNGGDNAGAARHLHEAAATPPESESAAYFAELSVAEISPNPRQPRQVFDEDAMAELVASVKEVGLLQPVVVRRVGGVADSAASTADGAADAGTAYELIMGERRWRAVQHAGLDTIPAIVRETGDDALLRDALLENLHRAELNPLEEAAAYQQLLEDFGCTHDELASRIGRSRPQISNTLRLLRLSPAVQRKVGAGVLSAGHARALLAVEGAGAQERLATRVVAEGISVRGLEEIVAVADPAAGVPEPGYPAGVGRPRRPTAPGLVDLAARLSERFETRVKVELGRRKGKISVEFASIPDLERIVAIMDPKDDKPI